MENNNIKAEFQIGRNYIKEFDINILDDKIPKKKVYSYELKVSLSDITTDEKGYQYSQILLSYNIVAKDENEKEFVKIVVKSIGQFRAPIIIGKDKFIEYCQYSGTPMLSQYVRAYIKAVTALSDIEAVNLPMINFVEFFEKAKEENSDESKKVKKDEENKN